MGEGRCREESSEQGTIQSAGALGGPRQGQRDPQVPRGRKLETDLRGHIMPARAAPGRPQSPCSSSAAGMGF